MCMTMMVRELRLSRQIEIHMELMARTLKMNSVQGDKIIDIHSHLIGGTKGGAGNDFNLAKSQRRNAVYLKDNGLKKDRKGMLYEYTKNQSRVKSIRILGNTDLVRYVKY